MSRSKPEIPPDRLKLVRRSLECRRAVADSVLADAFERERNASEELKMQQAQQNRLTSAIDSAMRESAQTWQELLAADAFTRRCLELTHVLANREKSCRTALENACLERLRCARERDALSERRNRLVRYGRLLALRRERVSENGDLEAVEHFYRCFGRGFGRARRR